MFVWKLSNCALYAECPAWTRARVALLCIATVAFCGTWIVEQPRSSLLFDHYRMKELFDYFDVLCLANLSFAMFYWLPNVKTPSLQCG